MSDPRITCHRGAGVTPRSSTGAPHPALAWPRTEDASVLGKAAVRALHAAGDLPAANDLLLVRAQAAEQADWTITIRVAFTSMPPEERRFEFPPDPERLSADGTFSAAFVCAFGPEDLGALSFPYVFVLDVTEDTPLGHAPFIEVFAFGEVPVPIQLGRPAPPPGRVPFPFSVLSYNTALLGADGFPIVDAQYLGKDREASIAGFIAGLRAVRPDVAGLCEMFKDDERARFKAELRDIYPFAAEGPDEADHDESGGVLFLSRFPIVATRGSIYRKFVSWDGLTNKGVVWIRVRTDRQGDVDLFMSHTQAVYLTKSPEDIAEQRAALEHQLDHMGHMSTAHRDPDAPAFLLGDLNFAEEPTNGGLPDYADSLRRLRGPRDLWVELHGPGSQTGRTYVRDNTFYAEEDDKPKDVEEPLRLDYVLMHPGRRLRPIPASIEVQRWKDAHGNDVSDHFGVLARFEEAERVDPDVSQRILSVTAAVEGARCVHTTSGPGDDEVSFEVTLVGVQGSSAPARTMVVEEVVTHQTILFRDAPVTALPGDPGPGGVIVRVSGLEHDDVGGDDSLGVAPFAVRRDELLEHAGKSFTRLAPYLLGDGGEYGVEVRFDVTAGPPAPPPPVPAQITTHITLAFLDPDGAPRPFPEGTPVELVFDGAAPSRTEQVGAAGALNATIETAHGPFQLRFQLEPGLYLATAPESGPQAGLPPRRLAPGEPLDQPVDDGWRVLRLPDGVWDMDVSTWTVHGEAKVGQRLDPRDPALALPLLVALTPRWQHLELTFIDRTRGSTHTIPPILIEGWMDEDAVVDDAPEVHSNWTAANGVLALPWILGMPTSKTPELAFRTPPNTYMETVPGQFLVSHRRLTLPARDTPDPARLSFYDLPELWRSRGWHAQRTRTGQDPEHGTFADFAHAATTPETPLRLSLDDMVLTDEQLRPIDWHPANAGRNQVALYCNTFAARGPSQALLSPLGVYRPTPARGEFFTTPPDVDAHRNYIWDFPAWTRLVVTQGNLFDVFDRRTPDRAGEVVGARAAVRWVDTASPLPGRTWVLDAANATQPAPAGARPRPGVMVDPPPPPTRTPFFTMQPYASQLADLFDTGDPVDRGFNGRCDLAWLRCCEHLPDKEGSVLVVWQRYHFQSQNPFLLVLPDLSLYSEHVVHGAALRWNGTGPFHPEPPVLLPESAPLAEDPARPLEVRVRWLVHAVSEPDDAHFTIEVRKGERASMNVGFGQSVWGEDDAKDPPGGFSTSAHEAAHGAGLGDEYVERDFFSGVEEAAGFHSYSPGSPYAFIEGKWTVNGRWMMNGSLHVHARYFWPAAEWLRAVDAQRPFFVRHGIHRYRLPRHDDERATHLVFPHRSVLDHERPHPAVPGGVAMFDLFLYPLGDDPYSRGRLPGGAVNEDAVAPGHDVRGILCVVLKIMWTFPAAGTFPAPAAPARYRRVVERVNEDVRRAFNLRATGAAGRFFLDGSVAPVDYRPCVIMVSARTLNATYPGTPVGFVSTTAPFATGGKVGNQADWTAAANELVADSNGPHVHVVVVRASGGAPGAAWSDGGRRLTVTCVRPDWQNEAPGLVRPELLRMLGIAKAAGVDAGDLLPIAQVLVPGAAVSDANAPPLPVGP